MSARRRKAAAELHESARIEAESTSSTGGLIPRRVLRILETFAWIAAAAAVLRYTALLETAWAYRTR